MPHRRIDGNIGRLRFANPALGFYYWKPANPRFQAGDIDADPFVWNSICCHNDCGVIGAFFDGIGATGPRPRQARARQTGRTGTGQAAGSTGPTARRSPLLARGGVPQRDEF